MREDYRNGRLAGPLILIGEDDPFRLKSLGNILKQDHYAFITAMNMRRLVEKFIERKPDLLIIDGDLEGTQEPQAVARILSLCQQRETHLVMLKRYNSGKDFFERHPRSIFDVIEEPLDASDILRRISLYLSVRALDAELADCKEQLELETQSRLKLTRKNAALEKTILRREETIRKMRMTDPLTGLYNYRYMMDHLAKKIEESRRYDAPLSVVLLCVDHFKAISAQRGVAAGDEILVKAAEAVKERLRGADIVARYGEDEFLILLPHTDTEGARLTAERIRRNIEGLSWGESENAVTVSGGVTSISGQSKIKDLSGHLLYRLIMHTENLLFKARTEGGNRIETG